MELIIALFILMIVFGLGEIPFTILFWGILIAWNIIVAIVVGITQAIMGTVLGIVDGLKNYFGPVQRNINFKEWEWAKDDEPAKRSYFFGPGYSQVISVIKESLSLCTQTLKKYKKEFDEWEAESYKNTGFFAEIGYFGLLIARYCKLYICAVIATVISLGLTVVLSSIHFAITFAFMIIIYVIFTIAFITDRIYLLSNKIKSVCPECKERFTVPSFVCPNCGRVHKKLVPGPYGIFKHVCTCGNKLPSTFFNGRSTLESCCPNCGSSLVASDARQIGFQLIGGTGSGKTVYLAACFHEYLEKLNKNSALNVTIKDEFQSYFDGLEELYNGEVSEATTNLNAQMYPIIINSPLGIKRQLSIYDIAGEMFNGNNFDNVQLQQQFHYCNGLLFIIDPFSDGTLRNDREQSGEDLSDFSMAPVGEVVTNFINYLTETGKKKPGERCSIPMAVLIAKADVKEVRREIGNAKLNSIYKKGLNGYESFEQTRDEECKKFLINIGYSSAVEELEIAFTNLHYFPVSAIGHAPDGTKYEPWGVTEPIEWMMESADKELNDIISSK